MQKKEETLLLSREDSRNSWELLGFVLFFGLLLLAQGQVPVYILFAVAIFCIAIKGLPLSPKSSAQSGLFFLFCLLLILDCFDAMWLRSLTTTMRYLVAGLLFQAFLGMNVRSRYSLYQVVLGIALLMGLGGFWQVFISADAMPLSWGEPGTFKRAFGLFDNPNLFATFLGLVSLPFLSKIGENFGRLRWPLFLFVVVCLAMTQSRGAVLAFSVVLVLALYLRSTFRAYILMSILTLWGVFFITGRANSTSSKNLGVNQRVELLNGVKTYLNHHWWGGTGAGTFHLYYPMYRTVGGYYPLYAHNHLLEVFCEEGVLGFGLFLLFCISVFVFSLVIYRREKSPLLLFLFLFSFCNSQFNQSFSIFSLICVLVFIAALEFPEKIYGMRSRSVLFLALPVIFVILSGFYEKGVLHSGKRFGLLEREIPKWILYRHDFSVSFLNSTVSGVKDIDENSRLLMFCHELEEKYPFEAELPYIAGKLWTIGGNSYRAFQSFERAMQLDPWSEKYGVPYLNYLMSMNADERFMEEAQRLLNSNSDYRTINPWYDQLQAVVLKFSHLRAWSAKQKREILGEPLIWVNKDFGKKMESLYYESS